MSKASQTYPLPEREKSAIIRESLLSGGILAFFGIVFATAAQSVRTGDWTVSFFGSTWLPFTNVTWQPHWIMLALPLALLIVFSLVDVVASRKSEKYRADVLDIRQGLNGELPRLDLPRMLLLCVWSGAAEEVAFRYGLLGFLVAASQALVPGWLTLAAVVVFQAALFAVVHGQYSSTWEFIVVMVAGIAFGAAFLITNNLIAVMVAHALYDFVDIHIERWHMGRNPDYFGGKVPTTVLVDAIGASGRRRNDWSKSGRGDATSEAYQPSHPNQPAESGEDDDSQDPA